MDILVGLALVVIGVVVCFAGLRVFFIALPIVGFVAGFFVGAAVVRSILGESFLSSVTGLVVGLIVGLVLAVISYLLWYVGALLSAGSTGALIGSGFMNAIGVETGWIVFIGAAAGAVLLFMLAFWLALPVYVVIVNTAFNSAAGVIAGVLLVFDQIGRGELSYGVAWATIEESWLWLLAWIALTVVGMLSQLRAVVSVTLPDQRWTPAQMA